MPAMWCPYSDDEASEPDNDVYLIGLNPEECAYEDGELDDHDTYVYYWDNPGWHLWRDDASLGVPMFDNTAILRPRSSPNDDTAEVSCPLPCLCCYKAGVDAWTFESLCL